MRLPGGTVAMALIASASVRLASSQTIADIRSLTVVADGKYCVDFSPYVAGYEPGVEPPRGVVSQQLDSLLASGKVKCLLTYGSLGGAAFVPALLREKGRTDIKVIQGVWLDDYDGNNAPNDAQIDAGVALANSYRDVIVAVMCGSEIRLRHNRAIAVPLVRDCVNRMRAAGVQQPLTHQATWPEWCNEETPGELFPRCERWDDVASIVDFISQTTYSWWENRVKLRFPCVPPDQAAEFHMNRQFAVAQTYPEKLVIMSEVGYPGPPFTYTDTAFNAPCSVANKQLQLQVMGETLGFCAVYQQGCILFSAENEPWKGEGGSGGEGVFGAYWGYCGPDAPYSCALPDVTATGTIGDWPPGWPVVAKTVGSPAGGGGGGGGGTPVTGPGPTTATPSPTASLSTGASPSSSPSAGQSSAASALQPPFVLAATLGLGAAVWGVIGLRRVRGWA